MPGRVLVIDDEASIRLACEKVLRAAGYEVEVAADGAEGLERLRPGAFDVALVDLKMPGVDGMEVLRRAREVDPDLVTIVITGYPSYESVVEAVKAGAYDYIPKPFSPDELRTVVGRGYEKHDLERQARLLREERARNLATIAEERGRLLTVINSMADGVMVTDREGRLVLYNPAAARWLAPDPLGRPLGEVCGWGELEGLVREVTTTGGLRSLSTDLASEKGAPTFMVTVAPVLAGAEAQEAAAGPGPGGPRPAEAAAGPGGAGPEARRAGREVLGAVLVLRDVTELRRQERERANFMAMVCHEIRVPLSAIAGYLELMLQGVVGQEAWPGLLERCRARAEGLVALIQDMLDLSRMETLVRQVERVAVREVVEESVAMLGPQAERAGVTVRVEAPDEETVVSADRFELGRVVTNLLSNAIKFNRPRGSATVSWRREGDYLVIRVEGTGIGIEPRHLPRLGEEFYRVREEATAGIPGSGLGLSIVRNIARSYHGDLRITSEPGVGTAVEVRLACCPGL